MAQLLLRENCTVTVAHSRTRDLAGVVRQADIVVAAVGRPQMIKGDWIKPGATVIDVGINRIPAPERGEGKTRLVGDVDYAAAAAGRRSHHAGARRGGADDHRVPAGEHGDDGVADQRPRAAEGPDALVPRLVVRQAHREVYERSGSPIGPHPEPVEGRGRAHRLAKAPHHRVVAERDRRGVRVEPVDHGASDRRARAHRSPRG